MKQKPADLVTGRLTDFPGFVAARQRYQEIRAERERNDAERQSILDRLNARQAMEGDWSPSIPVAMPLDQARILFVEPESKPMYVPPPNPNDVAAQAVLEGTASVKSFMPDRERETLMERYEVMTHQLRILTKAEKLALAAMEHERRIASTAICKSIKPEYAKIVGRIGVALVELCQAAECEVEFRDFLDDEEIILNTTLITPVPFTRVGSPKGLDAPAGNWLDEARRLGYSVPR